MLDYLADDSHNASSGIVFMDFAGVEETVSQTYEVKGEQLVQAHRQIIRIFSCQKK